MKRLLLAAILLWPSLAMAQDAVVYITPVIPSEEMKIAALKRAYELNGNSMVRMGAIDLTETRGVVRTIRITPAELALPAAVPVAEPLPVQKAELVSDICTRKGMHKMITNGGRSWRCRK